MILILVYILLLFLINVLINIFMIDRVDKKMMILLRIAYAEGIAISMMYAMLSGILFLFLLRIVVRVRCEESGSVVVIVDAEYERAHLY